MTAGETSRVRLKRALEISQTESGLLRAPLKFFPLLNFSGTRPKLPAMANRFELQVNQKSSRTLWLVVSGALLGAVLTTWLAPKVIAWYFEPPAQYGFNCRAPIEWSLQHMQISQIVGIVVGAILGLVLGLTVFRRKAKPVTSV